MSEEKTSFEFECYALMLNVDSSILQLNSIINNDGYEFIEVNGELLESRFSKLFNVPSNLKNTANIKFQNGMLIGKEFFHLVADHPLGKEFSRTGKMYFLKKVGIFKQKTIGNQMSGNGSLEVISQTSDYGKAFVRKLRLYKNGDISIASVFSIVVNSDQIFTQLGSLVSNRLNKHILTIKEDEILQLREHLNSDLDSINLTKIAELYFNNSYQSLDIKTQFIDLMTALEALFNRSDAPISHIISRHLALIISANKSEFDSNYKRIKKLYGIRSKIVHGATINFKENLTNTKNELQDLTRKAIVYCLNSKSTKDELFNYLNSKGFN